jgi:hypothetical protein
MLKLLFSCEIHNKWNIDQKNMILVLLVSYCSVVSVKKVKHDMCCVRKINCELND